MAVPSPIIYIVDDDHSVRDGLDNLFRSIGYCTQCFSTVDEFLSYKRDARPSCLVLDVRMPGRDGFDLQHELRSIGERIPVVFLTGHGDVPMSVRAMRNGAIDFLLKPFREFELVNAVNVALAEAEARIQEAVTHAETLRSFATLSPRELQVVELVAKGHPNKDIARSLDLKEITIKVHRARALKKLNSSSLHDLFQKACIWENLKRPL